LSDWQIVPGGTGIPLDDELDECELEPWPPIPDVVPLEPLVLLLVVLPPCPEAPAPAEPP
jgi:hypothetical protein